MKGGLSCRPSILPVPTKILPVANQAAHKIEGLPRRLVLTLNVMITGQHSILAVEDEEFTEEEEMRKRAKHILKCKQAIWKRWTGEYLRALRERHNLKYERKERIPKVDDVVLIKDDSRNRGKWSVGIVEELYQGRDGVVRGAKLKT
jgi:hypothetical protein